MQEALIAVVGFSPTIIGMLGGAIYWISRRFVALEYGLNEMSERVAGAIEGLKNAVLAIRTSLVEYLGLKGPVEESEVRYLISQAMRIVSMVKVNPLTEGEFHS